VNSERGGEVTFGRREGRGNKVTIPRDEERGGRAQRKERANEPQMPAPVGSILPCSARPGKGVYICEYSQVLYARDEWR